MTSGQDDENRFVFRLTQIRGPTPEFVRWSIDRPCEIRQPIESNEPEKVERYLRPLAAIGESLSLNRVVDGLCVAVAASQDDPARGCFLHEVADFYGGLEFCRSQCGGCPSNIALTSDKSRGLSGCFGWLIRDEILAQRLDREIEQHRGAFLAFSTFKPTRPAWYGLWSVARLVGDQLDFVGRLFDGALVRATLPADWRRFREALAACRKQELSLSVELVPAGVATGTDWMVGPFCPDCKAPMDDDWRHCPCCGRQGHAHPAWRRKVRGQRPFVQLDGLVGPKRAAELVAKLAAQD